MQDNCDIFDDETEPRFNVKPIELPSILLDDCLFVLGTNNVDNIEQCSRLQGHFKNGHVVHLFILLCDLLRQPPEVKYHAIELFDVFMTEHIRYLRRYVRNNNVRMVVSKARGSKDRWRRGQGGKGPAGPLQWRIVIKRVKDQILLRVLSCIQIASKLVCQPKVMLSIGLMEQVLRKAGLRFGRKSIQKSELRVLDTVGHRSSLPTPIVYVEALLEILGHNDRQINLRALHHVALQVLDLFYLRRSRVYSEMFRRTTGIEGVGRRKKEKRAMNEADFLPITNDLMFASTAVISCAAYLLDEDSYLNLTQQLHSVTRIPYDEIMDFTIVLVGAALDPATSQFVAVESDVASRLLF